MKKVFMLHSVKHGAWIFEKDSQKNEKCRFENSNSVHNFITKQGLIIKNV